MAIIFPLKKSQFYLRFLIVGQNRLKLLSKTLIAALLVGGTSLGAGMLALPIATAGSSLLSSYVIYIICWLFSLSTGLLFVEIGLWMPKNANIVSMANNILGYKGNVAAWILYIFLFYCLTIAYVSEGGRLISQLLDEGGFLLFGNIIFSIFFGLFVYLGTKVVGKLNVVLMIGLIVFYIIFIIIGVKNVKFDLLSTGGIIPAVLGLPVIFTSFSYQGIIPSLLTYLNRDAKKMRIAIICGTSIPFIAYVIWDFIIKGIVPVNGLHGLMAAKQRGISAVEPLYYFVNNRYIYIAANFFAFFALATSFIGVTLGLLDFLFDSLKVKKSKINKFVLCCVIYIPPIIVSVANPGIFITALSFAGGFGCVLLLGLLPTIMVWIGRYKIGYSSLHQQLPGGRVVLVILLIFIALEIIVEIIQQVY